MKFFVGLVLGGVGMWAYSSGRLQTLMGRAPAPVQDAFSKAGDQVNQVANHDQIRGFVAKTQDTVQDIAKSGPEGSGLPAQPEAR
jgi:hypothetical protein